MDLQYKGINSRGRAEWLVVDLARPYRPDGLLMEEWQLEQYKRFLGSTQDCIGRELTKEELDTVAWLSGSDPCTIDSCMSIIKSAYINGKENQ
jgi:hypothetical protein